MQRMRMYPERMRGEAHANTDRLGTLRIGNVWSVLVYARIAWYVIVVLMYWNMCFFGTWTNIWLQLVFELTRPRPRDPSSLR